MLAYSSPFFFAFVRLDLVGFSDLIICAKLLGIIKVSESPPGTENLLFDMNLLVPY